MAEQFDEPWRIDGVPLTHSNTLVDARDPKYQQRIVACVNACTGIPTEALQRGALGEVTRALLDAAVMLENIERNRNMPPEARTLQQYIALGRQMRAVLATLRGEG